MKKPTHTPEPWWTNGREIGDMPMMNTKICNKISGNSYEEAQANASRIVACVNFCEGIDNEHLQDDTLRKALAKATADLIIANEKIEHLTSELKKAK